MAQAVRDSAEAAVRDFRDLIVWHVQNLKLRIFEQRVRQEAQFVIWNVDDAQRRRAAQHVLVDFANIIMIE